MSLARAQLTELLLERIYDVLWHNDLIFEDTDEQGFKDVLRPDLIIQLDIIENELHPDEKK